eukprot:TRINITY_DN6334_c0_g5_i1.p1 TRINITY_DN6334_c0_g5~~TRINITY_DN6334_c0_g5_i1.p1  ORF type:complete len:298 (+),score=46.85 TRINITY_DN6334_c0_g5_i1:65-958(+)
MCIRDSFRIRSEIAALNSLTEVEVQEKETKVQTLISEKEAQKTGVILSIQNFKDLHVVLLKRLQVAKESNTSKESTLKSLTQQISQKENVIQKMKQRLTKLDQESMELSLNIPEIQAKLDKKKEVTRNLFDDVMYNICMNLETTINLAKKSCLCLRVVLRATPGKFCSYSKTKSKNFDWNQAFPNVNWNELKHPSGTLELNINLSPAYLDWKLNTLKSLLENETRDHENIIIIDGAGISKAISCNDSSFDFVMYHDETSPANKRIAIFMEKKKRGYRNEGSKPSYFVIILDMLHLLT